MPRNLVSRYLVDQAKAPKIIKFLGYTVVTNNLNPITWCYEDPEETHRQYVWVHHESFGYQLENSIKAFFAKSNLLNDLLR